MFADKKPLLQKASFNHSSNSNLAPFLFINLNKSMIQQVNRTRFLDITLSDLQNIEYEVAHNEQSAVQLLVKPRTFFSDRGYLLPARAKITILPTEEKKERLYTKE